VQGAEGFALRKGDPDALNFFNNWILLRQQDGWLKERHDYWFKTRDWAGQVVE
jgi:polar amino acid transport system substrate-binding protein